MTDQQPITRLPRSGLPARAVVVGDPDRATAVAALLDETEPIGENREYRSYRGRWRGHDVVVSSHGVGGPGAVLMFSELAVGGVTTILRYGTAGALHPDIVDGDLVIGEAAVRDDGLSGQLVPSEYPAYSAPEAVLALAAAADGAGLRAHRGIIWTRAAFSAGVLELPVDTYTAARVIAIEMELATLYTYASLNGLRAGGVLVIDGNAAADNDNPGEYDPHRTVVVDAVTRGCAVALDALVAL